MVQIYISGHKQTPTQIKTMPAIIDTANIPLPTTTRSIAKKHAETIPEDKQCSMRRNGATARLMLSIETWNSSGAMMPINGVRYVESNSDPPYLAE